MGKSEYRSTNVIIQSILETLLKADQGSSYVKKGIVKTHLVKTCRLKALTAEKYFEKMENAGYVTSHSETWGERSIIMYEITPKGKERYEWFVKINTELEMDTDGGLG